MTTLVLCFLLQTQIVPIPGDATLWTDDGFLAYPGRIKIVHRDLDSKNAVLDTIRSYNLTCPSGSETHDKNDRLVGRASTCTVEKGHEKFWIAALALSPGVGRVELVPLTSASTSNEALHVTFRRQTPSGTTAVHGANAINVLGDFLTQRYKDKGKATILKKTDRFIELQVTGLRRVVVTQEKLWEHLTIRAALTGAESAESVYVVVDGRFAHGVGQHEPGDARFDDMTGSYDQALERYVAALTNDIAEHFKS